MSEAVLDSSALLALLRKEPGADRVAAAGRQSVVSTVNLAETATVLTDIGIPKADLRSVLSDLSLTTVPFDEEDALLAAELRPVTRAAGLSLGDRACLALAQRRKLPALTADRAWADLDLGIEVRLIR